MFDTGPSTRTRRDDEDDAIYAKAGRRMLEGGTWGNYWQLEFQKALDRHTAAMERLAAAIEQQNQTRS